MSTFPVGMSMTTSFLSGLTLVSTPYEIYTQGWGYALVGLACMVAGPIGAYLIVPVFYRCQYLSIYQVSRVHFHHILIVFTRYYHRLYR